MFIKTDENGDVVQFTSVGSLPGGQEIDLSMYKYVDGDLILDSEKMQAKINAVRIVEIKTRLSEIDIESVRPLRAMTSQSATQDDINKLASLEAEAINLRTELGGLINGGQV